MSNILWSADEELSVKHTVRKCNRLVCSTMKNKRVKEGGRGNTGSVIKESPYSLFIIVLGN